MLCCLAREKYLQAGRGNVLIDDWEKHRHRWEGAGGIWITHQSAAETAEELDRLGLSSLAYSSCSRMYFA